MATPTTTRVNDQQTVVEITSYAGVGPHEPGNRTYVVLSAEGSRAVERAQKDVSRSLLRTRLKIILCAFGVAVGLFVLISALVWRQPDAILVSVAVASTLGLLLLLADFAHPFLFPQERDPALNVRGIQLKPNENGLLLFEELEPHQRDALFRARDEGSLVLSKTQHLITKQLSQRQKAVVDEHTRDRKKIDDDAFARANQIIADIPVEQTEDPEEKP